MAESLSPHLRRAMNLLREAAEEIEKGAVHDVIPWVSEAQANLQADIGELDPDDAAELLKLAEEDEEEEEESHHA